MNAALPVGSHPSTDRQMPIGERHEAPPSPGVCWGAVLAGAAGAASLSLILLMLGVGLGLSSVSPWSGEGVSAQAFGLSTILWLTFTQLAASGLGGYLAGRLRTRWAGVQADEVYFRDTAHGFLAWSLAALVSAGLLGSAAGVIVGAGAKAGGTVAATAVTAAAPLAAQAASAAGPGYFVDGLFRRDLGAAASAASAGADASGGSAMPSPPATASAEGMRIFANAVSTGALPQDDVRQLGRLVSQQTGMPPADAERRVVDTFNRMQTQAEATRQEAKAAADKARKAAAKAALWGFVALLIGAFTASWSATLGGRHRDQF